MKLFIFISILVFSIANAQPWEQNDLIFNPSGIPSLAFSQPRFADVDADGDYDLILGNISDKPLFFENTGSASNPAFHAGADIFAPVNSLDADMGVFIDLDNDNDPDFLSGGYTGLNYFENIGDSTSPVLSKIDNFFSGLSVGSNPIPTLADMDADNDFDLLVGLSEDGALKYYPNTGTADSAIFSELNVQTWFDVGLYAYPYFSDLDNDSDYDLLAGRDGLGFNFYRNTGDSSQWQWQQENSVFSNLGQSSYWNSPCLVDLNNDNKKDIIFGTASGPLNYYRNTGTAVSPTWTVNNSLFGGVLDVGGASSPFFIDFDYDGDLDLLSGVQLGSPKYYKNIGTPSGPAWQGQHTYFNSITHSIYMAVTAGDVNGDSLPDVVAGNLNGELFFHQNTGSGFTELSSVFAGIDVGDWAVPRLIDMDFDSDLDLMVGNELGTIWYFENTGTPDTANWVLTPNYFGGLDVGYDCAPTFGDIDSDGDLDLVTGNLFHEIQYFRNDNGSWTEDPTVVSGITAGQNATPALADLDNDGDLDLTIGNYEGTFNYYENKLINSGIYDKNETMPSNYWIVKVFPNPFNNTTNFKIDIPDKGRMELVIYNVLGEQVYSKNINLTSTGENQFSIIFPGYLSSGIYYYILKFNNTNVHKLMNGKLVYLK